MAVGKEVRTKIASVKNTQKITNLGQFRKKLHTLTMRSVRSTTRFYWRIRKQEKSNRKTGWTLGKR